MPLLHVHLSGDEDGTTIPLSSRRLWATGLWYAFIFSHPFPFLSYVVNARCMSLCILLKTGWEPPCQQTPHGQKELARLIQHRLRFELLFLVYFWLRYLLVGKGKAVYSIGFGFFRSCCRLTFDPYYFTGHNKAFTFQSPFFLKFLLFISSTNYLQTTCVHAPSSMENVFVMSYVVKTEKTLRILFVGDARALSPRSSGFA